MSNVTVVTVRKSIAIVPPTWLRRDVFQVCEGGRRGRRVAAFVSSDNAVDHLCTQNGAWTDLTLTATAGAPIAVGQIAMTGDSAWTTGRIHGLDAHVGVLTSNNGWTWTEIASGATSRW